MDEATPDVVAGPIPDTGRRLAWSASSVVSMTASSLAIVAALTRTMAKEDFGAFAVTQTVCVLTAVLGRFGSEQLMLREMAPRPDGAVEWATGAAILRTTALASAVAATLGAAVAWAALPESTDLKPAVAAGAFVWVVAESNRLALSEGVRATGRFVLGTATGHLGRSVLLLAGAAFVVIADVSSVAGAVAIGAATSVGTWALAAVAYASTRARRRDGEAAPVTASLRRHGLLLTLSGLSSIGLSQADVLLVGLLAGGRDAATYAISLRLANLLAFPLYVTAFVAGPTISRWMRTRQGNGAITSVRRLVTMHSAAVVVGFAALAVLGPTCIRVLAGDGYDDALGPALILAVGVVVNGLTGPAGDVLVLAGHPSWVAAANTASLAGAVVASSIAYVVADGIEAVAVSFALAMATQNVVLALLARRRVGFPTTPIARGLLLRAR